MSAVLLMTDTWQPTVLRLVPFSNNNAKDSPRKGNIPSYKRGNNRNFPVLAVTRSGGKGGAITDRSYSAQTVVSDSVDSEPSCDTPRSAYSETTDNDTDTRSGLTVKRHRKYAKKKIPETRSEMKEAIRFSVQDINDQVSSSSSLHSEVDRHSKTDYTRTRLPKPSICQQHELKIYSPVNGVRRSVPLTPGELELQKFRDSYNHEQSFKRRKYKLNVNQLPRSTTPINDHDPDKLNMKQVIAFLQTKASKDIQKKVVGNRSPTSPGRVCRSQTFYRQTNSPTKRNSRYTEVEDKTDNTRMDNSGCVSVLSTKSTPNISFGARSTKNNKNSTTTRSMKSFKDDSSTRTSSTLKDKRAVKEFKLYRFLAVAPENNRDNQEFGSPVTEVDSKTQQDFESPCRLPSTSPRRTMYRKQRDSTTANLLHRRAATKNGISNPKISAQKSAQPEEAPRSIRLPSMNDEVPENDDESNDTCSTTSATCNSTKNSSYNDDRSRPKKGKCIQFTEEQTDVDPESHTISGGDFNNNNNINSVLNSYLGKSKQPYKYAEVNKTGQLIEPPKQIHVNMPKEDNKIYSQEIVRLTLRNDKHTTRVTSYMSDLQPTARAVSGAWSEFKGDRSSDLLEKKEWFESPRELINTVAGDRGDRPFNKHENA